MSTYDLTYHTMYASLLFNVTAKVSYLLHKELSEIRSNVYVISVNKLDHSLSSFNLKLN